MMLNTSKTLGFFSVLLFIFFVNNLNAQSYCTPINTGSNNSFYINKVNIASIFNISDNSESVFKHYNTLSTDLIKGESYATNIIYKVSNYNQATLKVWIDFNGNGSFNDSGETVYSYTTSEPYSADGITRNFQIAIPTTATSGNTRMRVAISRTNLSDACNAQYQAGEIEDYNINIKPIPVAPTANCIGSINLSLDVTGKASITTADVNNGSFDDFDAANDLVLSLDTYNFSCSDVSNPKTVTLTVTDSDGLSSSCTTTVSVTPYTGNFTAPTLPDITEYCSYTATTPVMNFKCGQQITATTTDTTTFNTAGSYTINWVFDNGTETKTSTQNISILTPTTPSNITVSNVSETTAIINFTSSDVGTFKIRYRLKGTSDLWTEITSTTTSKKITGLDDGLEYEVQIKTISSCSSYSSLTFFTTVEVLYCNNNVNLNKDSSFYISNVNIGNINNSSTSSENVYKYYNNLSTNLVAGETFSGNITYSRDNYNATVVVIWIDFNNNGDFSDAGEKILTVTNSSDSNSVFNIPLTNILVPSTATLGKTRLRVSLKQSAAPTSACNFDHKNGEIEDYDVYLTKPDNSDFESALITQIYHYGTTDRWIEITNTNTSKTIPANKIVLALFKDTSGDQTNVVPSNTFLINTSINPGESLLVKKPTSTITTTAGVSIENSAITDFNDTDDILIISKKTDATAWQNRYDVVSNIKNNTSYVRSDKVTTFNTSYTNTEWVAFIDDNLSTSTNPPERHPHAPLISEVIDANATSNVRLGVHKINKTIRESNSWTNGFPDRSRSLLINENLTFTNKLSANNLEIANGFKLAINNNLLVVTDQIKINTNAEIRLIGSSQLIQTHSGAKNISGNGKLYVDQNSTLDSKYRFNYMSSPVASSVGLNTFTIANVMKDGTTATSLNSTPKDINFIGGYDGNYNNSPSNAIEIADYWIYTYDFNNADYIHKYSNGTINSAQGFLFKGPGRAQNYTFVGSPNDGDYQFSVSGNTPFLVGNPYPSSLNSKKFIEDNIDATTGTLYFWEHTAEKNTEGTTGHNYSGYIGGYATRNISMGISANNLTSNTAAQNEYFYNIEAEKATLGGTAKKENNTILLEKTNDYLTFENLSISQTVDSLRVVYKANKASNFHIFINGKLKKSKLFTSTENVFDTIKIPLQLKNTDTLLLKLKGNKNVAIDKILLRYCFTYTAPEQYIPIGQGFFVASDTNGGTITFNNSQREFVKEGENSVLLKTTKKKKIYKKDKNPLPILKIEMNYKDNKQKQRSRKIGISFSNQNSFDFEKGYDSELFDLNKTDFFWSFLDNDKKYVIAGVQEISEDLKVPLGITIGNREEISINMYQWNLPNQNVYLLDKLTNTYSLLNNNTPVFKLDKGEYLNRFFLAFKKPTETLDTNHFLSDKLKVFYNNNFKEININVDNNLNLTKAKLYAISGQKIGSWIFKNTNLKEYKIKINNLSKNIYILKITTDKGAFSTKLLLN